MSKKSNLNFKIKQKIKYKFIKFNNIEIKQKSNFGDKWPFIDGIDEITIYYFGVRITGVGKPRISEGISCQINQENYSLNGIAKEATGFPFPYEEGVIKNIDNQGGPIFMDINVLLED